VLLEVDPGLYVKMFRRHHGHSRLGAEQLRAKAERAVWRHLEAKLKARLEEIGHRIGTVPLLAAPEEA
jgi:hypothetical protein